MRELHANFLTFIEERAPMLRVFSVQESPYTKDSAGKRVTRPPMLEDAVISLNHRYERFETSYQRFDLMPKVQYSGDFTVRKACWEANSATVEKCPQNLESSSRQFVPFELTDTLLGRNSEISNILDALNEHSDLSPRVGLVGPTALGKLCTCRTAFDTMLIIAGKHTWLSRSATLSRRAKLCQDLFQVAGSPSFGFRQARKPI